MLSALICIAISIAVFFRTYSIDRKNYVRIWGFGWIAWFVYYLAAIWLYVSPPSDIALTIEYLAVMASDVLFLSAVYSYAGKRLPRHWRILFTADAVWIIAAILADADFMTLTVPVSILNALAYICIGVFLLKRKDLGGKSRITAGVSFIVWGVHQGDYPFLARTGSLAEWGVLIGLILGLASIAGLLIIYVRRIRNDFRHLEDDLSLQKAYFRQLFENSPQAIVLFDENYRILNVNEAFETMFQYSLYEIKNGRLNDFIVPQDLLDEAGSFDTRTSQGEYVQTETVRRRKDGTLVNVFLLSYPVYHKNKLVAVYAVYNDITDRKKAEDQIREISIHDSLTGLFNRTFFQQAIHILEIEKHESLGIIVCDVDGLKLMNDTMGHEAGDRLLKATADIIRKPFNGDTFIARIGGDEFVVILPDCTPEFIDKVIDEIHKATTIHNLNNRDILLGISIGSAYATDGGTIDIRALFKKADARMYREKLLHSQSTRSDIVLTLMKVLEQRDFIQQGHAARLYTVLDAMAGHIGMTDYERNMMKLFSSFHDIGKVGIHDSILFKAGRLTSDEIEEMRRHCEIGYRIAQSSPDLIPIADWILKHHEWWNGSGYPFMLKGYEIPLQSRMLCIADAYDAMISDRPYRSAMKCDDALSEIERLSSIQFDPGLVTVFKEVIRG